MADTFKKGDEVQHRAGNPKMIVKDVIDENRYLCSWITPGETPREKIYESHELKPFEEKEK